MILQRFFFFTVSSWRKRFKNGVGEGNISNGKELMTKKRESETGRESRIIFVELDNVYILRRRSRLETTPEGTMKVGAPGT